MSLTLLKDRNNGIHNMDSNVKSFFFNIMRISKFQVVFDSKIERLFKSLIDNICDNDMKYINDMFECFSEDSDYGYDDEYKYEY